MTTDDIILEENLEEESQITDDMWTDRGYCPVCHCRLKYVYERDYGYGKPLGFTYPYCLNGCI